MKKELRLILVIFLAVFIIILVYTGFLGKFSGKITGEVISDICWCLSCEDCNSKLRSAECKTVELNRDIEASGDCISDFDKRIFDCKNHKIKGNGKGNGIDLTGDSENIIKNCEISNFNYAIYLSRGEKNEIIGNKLSNSDSGLEADNSQLITISENKFEANIYGMDIYKGSSEIIKNNRVCDNEDYDMYVREGVHHFSGNICERANRIGVCEHNCSYVCIENWECSEWEICTEGKKTRTCQDLNSCGTINNKPSEEETCISEEKAEEEKVEEEKITESWLKRFFKKLFGTG